jgi:uncharacterized repeat protein (TIGR03803 family)
MKFLEVAWITALALAVVLVLAPGAAQSVQAQTLKVLHSFEGADGANPEASLVRDAVGNLYGTTLFGGASGAGTVFKLDRTGEETFLYSFTGGADGRLPMAALIQDKAGNLYGTAFAGGDFNACMHPLRGCGTVFKVDTTGRQTVLYRFTGDGKQPSAGLVRDATGNLYGTTRLGGGGSCGFGCGTVFKLDPGGRESVLYRFNGGTDGALPPSALIRDKAGNLYGTTVLGGKVSCNPPNGCGVVFKLHTTGAESVLHSFSGRADGAFPSAGLVRDKSGNLYGTTSNGGDQTCSLGCGVVFKLDTKGKEKVLYSFKGGMDGANPEAGLVRDAAGNLYGTTFYGGGTGCYGGCGTVFKVGKGGNKTLLYSFTGGADGGNPYAGVIGDAAGNLYGTTFGGGVSGGGIVFKLKP